MKIEFFTIKGFHAGFVLMNYNYWVAKFFTNCTYCIFYKGMFFLKLKPKE